MTDKQLVKDAIRKELDEKLKRYNQNLLIGLVVGAYFGVLLGFLFK